MSSDLLCLAQAVHGDALTHYFHAYRHAPRHPLTLLCLAVCFLNQVRMFPVSAAGFSPA